MPIFLQENDYFFKKSELFHKIFFPQGYLKKYETLLLDPMLQSSKFPIGRSICKTQGDNSLTMGTLSILHTE